MTLNTVKILLQVQAWSHYSEQENYSSMHILKLLYFVIEYFKKFREISLYSMEN